MCACHLIALLLVRMHSCHLPHPFDYLTGSSDSDACLKEKLEQNCIAIKIMKKDCAPLDVPKDSTFRQNW